MRLDRGRPKIWSKLYSNRLLIDIFDPNLAIRSIVPMISIRNLGSNSKLDSNLSPNLSIISKIGQIWTKNVQNRQIILKYDQIRPDSTIFGPKSTLDLNSDRDFESDCRDE